MRAKHLELMLTTLLKNNRRVLIKGQPGIGKSDIVAQACAKLGYELIISHPVVADPTDYKGLPFVIDGQARFLPFGDLEKLINADHPIVFFLDDLGQATPAVQSAVMQLLLARQINGHKISKEVRFVAATNRREDRANVSGILEPVKSRFHSIVELTVDVDDWIEWAYKNDMPPELIGFIQWRPQMLNDFKATRDIENSPCPRTVAFLGVMWNDGIPKEIQFETIKGAVGEAFAIEFLAYVKLFLSLPSVHQIARDPMGTPVPSEVSARIATMSAIVDKMSVDNIDPLAKYLKRMEKEFYVAAMKNAATKNPHICATGAFGSFAVEYGYILSDVS